MYLAIISGQGLSISLEVLSGATDHFGDLVVRGDFPHPLFYVPVHPLLFVEGLQTPVPSNISEVSQRRHPWTLDLYCDPVPQYCWEGSARSRTLVQGQILHMNFQKFPVGDTPGLLW